MVDQDIKIKIKEVIEATILSIIQEQSEKIEKLEKIVEQQQERIEHLESKVLVQGQHSGHKSLQHITSNQNQGNSEQKPDSSAIKTQLKKLEQDKGSEQKQRPASKPKTINVQPQKSSTGYNSTRQQIGETKQVQAKEAIKALPEPKKMKPSTNDTTKALFNSSQPIKPLGQNKHHASTKDLGMKKSPSQANQLTVNDSSLVKSQSPKNGTKSTFFPKSDDGQSLKSPEKIKSIEEDQFVKDIQSELKENDKDAQESIISSQQSDVHEIVETLQQQLEQSSITVIDEGKLIQIDFKTMTIDSFAIIEMNFVNDLLSQQEIPDSIKLVVFTFLLIVEENNKYNFEESNFWEKASKFLQENEKTFPQFLTSVLQKKFQQSQLEQIRNLIQSNPDLMDPDKFEDIDALTCSLAYFIKDFYVGLQKMS